MTKKRKQKPSPKGLRYNGITPKNFPPGYFNAKVVGVRKAKGKPQIIITIQVEKKINL